MTRPMMKFLPSAALLCALTFPLGLAAQSPSIGVGRFPLLSRMARDLPSKSGTVSLDEAERAALLDEIAIERLLWRDELEHLERRAAASGVALSRIEAVRDDVERKLQALETAIEENRLDPALLASSLDPGLVEDDAPHPTILSGAGLRLPQPSHREVVIANQMPDDYWTAPGPEYEKRRAKALGESDPVADLAAGLGHDPIALYNHVLRQIKPVNAYGLSRTPEGVLASGVGTSADQAALLAELYRAADFPARLVWGVQELSIDSLRDHFGLDGPQLENALMTGGWAWSPVVEAGRIKAYRVSRIWCEVWIPFVDFRGVVLDQGGTTWLPLDPWIMTDEPWPERRIVDEMNLDGNDMRQRVLGGEFCTGALDAPGACPTLVEALSTEVDAWLGDHGEMETFDDLAAPRPSAIEAESILPAAMVGRIVSVDGYGIELPESLRFRLGVRASAGAQTLLEKTLDVAQLSAGEAVIWYEPAAAEDVDVVEALGGYLWDVPPYLVNVVPVVMVGQDVIARAEGPTRPGIGMGRGFTLELMMTTPAGSAWSWSNSALAGVPIGLGVSAGRQGYETPYEQPASTIQLLSKLTGDYLDGVTAGEEQLAALDHLALVHPMPSTVAVSAVIEPVGTLGMVSDLDFLGIQIDADIWGSGIAGGDMEARKRWRDLARLEASSRERRLFEEYQITSISADMALILAQAQGIEILHIDAGNLATALGVLPYDSGVESEIEAWVLSGGEADVPVTPLDFVRWSGVGYVLRDPMTGETKYQLAGNLSGGMTVLPAELIFEALPEMWPATSEEAIDDPSLAAILRIPSGLNGQIGEAGSEAGAVEEGAPEGTPAKTKAVQVSVLNEDGVAVKNVEVTFEIVAGDGHLIDKYGLDLIRVTVKTDNRGIARVRFLFDEHTGPVPGDEDNGSVSFYTQLEPDDFYATRVGANLIRVTTAPVSLSEDLWAFSAPGPLDDADVTNTQWSTVPEMLGGQAKVVARDGFGNPIANAEASVRIISGGGALLTAEEFNAYVLDQGGTILLGELPDPQIVLSDQTTLSDGKFATYVVLGPPDEGNVEIRFFVAYDDIVRNATTTMTKGDPGDGTILYSWSARPTGSRGQWIEGYHPGSEIARPMVLDLFRVEDGRPVRAPEDALRPSFEVSGLCPDGTILTSAPASTPGEETVGRWATGLQLGTTLGHCELYATIEENIGDGSWLPALGTGPSASVWTVEVNLHTPLRKIIVGVENTPVEEQFFPYYIWPTDYDPERTALVFAVDGRVVGLGEISGRGDGVLTIEPGAIVFDSTDTCTVQPVINPGVVWGMGTPDAVDLKVGFAEYPLEFDRARVHIAMDGNRDDSIDFNNPEDEKYLFWVNDDHDEQNYLQTESIWVEDDTAGTPNCNDDWIGHSTWLLRHGCKRDLEDFTRVQFQADEVAKNLSNLVYSLRFRNASSGDPSVNLFEAVECSMKYLQETSKAERQIQKERLVTVDDDHEAVIDSRYISPGSETSCFILEGKRAGKGDLTLLVKKNGILVSEESVELDLRPIVEFYDRFVVRAIDGDRVEGSISETTRGLYSAETDEYVLFVHGWNVDDWTKDRWAETMFKRFWWLGYKGRVGSFQWPTLGVSSYNRSEFRSWRSAAALKNLLETLNSSYPGQIRILAHSQGNVVAGEALRQSSTMLNSYIATQAAVSARIYDNSVPRSWFPYSTPDLYGFYSSGLPPSVPYFEGVASKVSRLIRYYNHSDFALLGWVVNNIAKPLFPSYFFNDFDGNVDTYSEWDSFFYDSPVMGDERTLTIPDDRYEIFSYCAESRSLALGAVDTPVNGFVSETNLQNFGYDWQHYSHSREFRSNIVDERRFWKRVARDFRLDVQDSEE